MVLLFMITSFQSGTPFTLFYKYFPLEFDSELLKTRSTSSKDASPMIVADEIRSARKSQKKRIEDRLHSVYQFNMATNPRSPEADLQILSSDSVVPEFETGHFKLYKGDPFSEDMRVIWTAVNGLILAFICHSHENRKQAEITLCLLVRQLHILCKSILQPNEIISKPDRVQIVLSKFLPDGNLLLMNHRTIKQMEREVESLLKNVSSF
ncbi:unnamed protein product [Lymnaea stagnalis]|uniref:AP-5 complex subunit sigma-1 n=1 Tax=Lymnaea stagnalis TaxID=6523 RepID=A0AAV2IDX6_LYMST